VITIREGTPADAGPLAELAETTFRDAFARDNRPHDLELYLSRVYGVEQQSAELADPLHTTLLAFVDDRLAGYAQVRPGEPPSCVTSAASLELWRFYVAQTWHGRGVAQALMAAVTAAARTRGARTLWLGVWERNERAQAFYRKAGFQDVGAQVFVLGTDEQSDRVMALSLDQSRPDRE
jgi:diamine N-acetyltransferase